jgi:hypothetical protein
LTRVENFAEEILSVELKLSPKKSFIAEKHEAKSAKRSRDKKVPNFFLKTANNGSKIFTKAFLDVKIRFSIRIITLFMEKLLFPP